MLATDEQERESARLDAEIERLGRVEENLIEAAFARGVNILRRANASPSAVLGVKARLAAPVARPARIRPSFAPEAAAQAAAAEQPAEAAE